MANLTKNYGEAIHNWLSRFATTYREPVTEVDTPNEYITHANAVGNFGETISQAISIYSKSTGYTNLMNIVDNIEAEIGQNGVQLQYVWGTMIIYKGNPFYQDKTDEDGSYRAGYINLEIKIYERGEL